ncbi:MAG: lysozyme inhibitor LprI family protein [Phormidesmis sp.]
MKKVLLPCLLASSLLALYACTPKSTAPAPTVQSSEPVSASDESPSEVIGSTDRSGSTAAAPDGYTTPSRGSNSSSLLIGPIVDDSEDCSSFNTQTEINMCAKRNVDTATAQLGQIRSFIGDSLTADGRTRLDRAETAWEKFRDLDCGFVSEQFTGGSIAPFVYGECANDHTLIRIKELAGEGQTDLSYADADAQLNQNYQSLKQTLSEPQAEALTRAQLAWIEYRDRNCTYEVNDSPTFTGTENQCLARMSAARADDLAQSAEQNSL